MKKTYNEKAIKALLRFVAKPKTWRDELKAPSFTEGSAVATDSYQALRINKKISNVANVELYPETSPIFAPCKPEDELTITFQPVFLENIVKAFLELEDKAKINGVTLHINTKQLRTPVRFTTKDGTIEGVIMPIA